MILCIFSPPSALFRFQLNISVFSCLCPQVKFNQALADHSMSDKPRLIDGIVLTKFDTIDDKVGAAISMTYITGQPIVFVGTGQTYNDLRSLNARAVVGSLMKP
ncbi:hypothetical protein ATANTOWER_005975 [Ataeniobius toweri]|uniref:SRP54-type proteins GTP-binding domain-containing protein n=1 Tax=Ataeniobius toweri TaxID=208326 RepID=A0ABU7ANZ3_9TELE|nr:hypothetical protein [Ataeniobius toweri]